MDIKKGVTLSAYKMRMGLHMGVEAICSVRGDFDDLAQIGQQRKIAVDGSQTDIRKFLFYMQINGICRGVVIPGQQKTLNGFSLTAIF